MSDAKFDSLMTKAFTVVIALVVAFVTVFVYSMMADTARLDAFTDAASHRAAARLDAERAHAETKAQRADAAAVHVAVVLAGFAVADRVDETAVRSARLQFRIEWIGWAVASGAGADARARFRAE